MLTEQRNPRSMNIDQQTTTEILQIINEEDATVPLVIREALPQIAQAVDGIVKRLQTEGRLIYVGAGTSGRLGMLDAVECVPTYSTPPGMVRALIAGGNTALIQAVEGAEDNHEQGSADLRAIQLQSQDVVVGIAASGRTPYVIGALETANQIGALTIAISCNTPAPILDLAQIKIALPVGPEVVTGSTRMKAGTAQKLALNMMSTAAMIKLGKVYGNLMVDVQVTNLKLAHRAQRIVSEIAEITQAEAAQLLEKSRQNTKVAIVMSLLDLTANEATELLKAQKGNLRAALNNR